MALRASFIKNVLEQTVLDGYGKPLYHLISWALLKRRYTHQHEIRRSKGKEKKLSLRFLLLLLIVVTTVVLQVIFPSSSIFACEKGEREGHSFDLLDFDVEVDSLGVPTEELPSLHQLKWLV